MVFWLMGRLGHEWLSAWVSASLYSTWIGEVGLGHWGRSGLSGGGGVGEEVIGGVSEFFCHKVV